MLRTSQYLQGGSATYQAEKRYLRKDGNAAWVSKTARMIRKADGAPLYSIGIVEDITARKRAEQYVTLLNAQLEERVAQRTAALQRANRALLVLKMCSEASARATDETALLQEICSILVHCGGAKMAWVGYAENDKDRTVRPVASAGDTDKYLENIRVTWGDDPHGQCPTGSAIRWREANVCHDIADDPRLTPCREKQLKAGIAASIALPLFVEESCLGALTIYASEPDAFNNEEVELFKQLAGDLAFGILALRTKAERAELQRELLTISEREKEIISQELHDGLCQNLAATAMIGSLLHKRLAAKNDPEAYHLKKLCDMLSGAVNEARHLSHGLQPVGPEPDGLMRALEQLAITTSNLFCIGCTFEGPESVLLKDEVVSTHLFRIAQEAVNNARKHGQADHIVISLKKTGEELALAIQDDGIGLPKRLPKKRGMGLKSMSRRADEIGATFTARRAEKKGTVVTCTLPWVDSASDFRKRLRKRIGKH